MLPSTLSSTLRRVLLAASAAVFLVGFASPAAAGPLCTGTVSPFPYDDTVDDGDGICRNFFPGDNAKFFLFEDGTPFEHLLRITVDEVIVPFGLRIMANLVPPGPINAPTAPGYNCVPYGPGNQCVEYKTVHPNDPSQEYHPIEGTDYEAPIVWLIAWQQTIGTDPIPEIFHDLGNDPESVYDEIMEGIFFSAVQGPNDFDCDNPDSTEGSPNECDDESYYDDFFKIGDPVRVALSDSFSRAQVGQQAPEPATATLFALMGAAYAVRMRRRGR